MIDDSLDTSAPPTGLARHPPQPIHCVIGAGVVRPHRCVLTPSGAGPPCCLSEHGLRPTTAQPPATYRDGTATVEEPSKGSCPGDRMAQYVWGVYWLWMPEYPTRNALRATRPVPPMFTATAGTEMACRRRRR